MNRTTEHSTGLQMKSVCTLLQVFDMPTSLQFYRDVLGFAVISSSPAGAREDRLGWVLLRHGDVEVMLNTAYDPDAVRPPHPEERRAAAHGDTILYVGCPDVDTAYRYLRDRGVDVRPPTIAPYGMKQLYVTDPDRFGLCFQWPVNAP